MKKRILRMICIILAAVFLLTIGVSGDDLWNDEYSRVIDGTEELSELKLEDLDQNCREFMEEYKTDLVLAAVRSEDYSSSSIEELAESYVREYGYGYGENRDCIVFIADLDKEVEKYVTFGNADAIIDFDYLEYVRGKVFDFREEYGVYGVLYGGAGYLRDAIKDEGEGAEGAAEDKGKKVPAAAPAASGESEAEKAPEESDTGIEKIPPEESNPVKENTSPENAYYRAEDDFDKTGLPDWYPEDISAFVPFHDENAPRVVDDAGIFNEAEEWDLESLINEKRANLNKDIVIFTDNSSHGMDKKVYAGDFYTFNGYGTGDEYEGVCLFICMDPDSRGWWACCTGPETRGLYTEDIANAIDDDLFPYMKAGDYKEGVMGWIENIAGLYEKGNPYRPEWLPYPWEETERFKDPYAERIADDIGAFSEGERSDLEKKVSEIANTYDMDMVVHTVRDAALFGVDGDYYAKAFYDCKGYGRGDSYDGLLLVIVSEVYNGTITPEKYIIYAEGSGNEKLSDVNRERLLGFISSDMEKGFFKGTDTWLKRVDHMEKTGRVSRSFGYWGWIFSFGSLTGLLTGGISLGKAKKKMECPKSALNADVYLDKDSLHVTGNDIFINTSRTRRYSPVRTSSSGSSSGSSHRSSYSSSYSSSSGRSHSGSGRSF